MKMKMKLRKLTLLFLANIIGICLMAEGYQINSQSARQLGMGHLGAALKLGGESMLFNPAGLSYMNGKIDLSLGATAILSKVSFTNVSGDYKAETDNPVGTPIFGYAGFKITDKLFAGVSITNPVGNSLFWPDNWRGSHLVQDISLKTFSVQPTLSWKFSEKFSIGAGLMIDFGDFEMNRGMLPVGSLAQYLSVVPAQYQTIINNTLTISPMSANLQGKSSTGFGFNVGVLFAPNDRWSFGVSYRSKIMMKLEDGETTINYGTAELQALLGVLSQSSPTLAGAIALDGQSFSAELPIPSNINVGAAFKVTDNLLLSAELQYVGWKAYDTLTIQFPGYAIKSIKNFKNSMIYRIGGEYKAGEKTTLRLGYMYDSTPVDTDYYGAETPGANKMSFTAGLTYTPVKMLAIDLGFQYLNGLKILGKTPQNAPLGDFVGEYKTTAFLPALGLRINF